ncbi:cache domain-containing protein [Paenibacillus sp. DMB20]|uniref:cache domain-containing protein n=1 Tax=Paenibacillus sp. DMB20 TaxID=1642570 RepID=UPI000AAA4678|nr:cache domain-containing protein [Paenibacillus sp. DMB20]
MRISSLFQPSLSINRRLMLLIVFGIGIPVSMMSWLWYASSTETIEQSAIATNKSIINQTNEYLDLYISSLENSTYPFVNHPQIQQLLDAPALTPFQYYTISEKVEDDLFAQMIYGRSDIIGMSLVADNQRQITDFSRAETPVNMKDVRTRNLNYLQQMESMDNYQVLGVGKIGSTPVLTVARKLHSSTSYLYKGLLIVDLNLRQIESISNNATPGGFTVWIASRNGDIVYHPEASLTGTRIPQEVMKGMHEGNSGYFRHGPASDETLVIYENSQITDWIVIADIPLRKVIGNLIHLRNLSLIAAVILVGITLSVVGGYSLFFVPIPHLPPKAHGACGERRLYDTFPLQQPAEGRDRFGIPELFQNGGRTEPACQRGPFLQAEGAGTDYQTKGIRAAIHAIAY